MTRTLPSFAAAVYNNQTRDWDALSCFAGELKVSDIRVGGLLQERSTDPVTGRMKIDMVDVETGARVLIKNPDLSEEGCTLDPSALADTTSVLRRNIADHVDLIVIQKFGAQEQKGEGLSDEIFSAIAEGIPVLIAVPETGLEIWQERSGELGAVLEFDRTAFDDWWRSRQA